MSGRLRAGSAMTRRRFLKILPRRRQQTHSSVSQHRPSAAQRNGQLLRMGCSPVTYRSTQGWYGHVLIAQRAC